MSSSVEKRIKEEAQRLGFSACGITTPDPAPFFDEFLSWIKDGRHADMDWLERGVTARADPSRLLKGCKSIICLAYPYSTQKPATPDGFTTARFTEGLTEDYHSRLKRLASPIVNIIQKAFPESKSRVCVDSAPLLERPYALKAGIGFIGKNNMLIVPGHGSFCYLVEVLTTAPLEAGTEKAVHEGCGDCDQCLKACPTGALSAPFLLDSRHCLSYLTIESRNPLPPSAGQKMNRCFFGCDACQEACPRNRDITQTRVCLPSIQEILKMEEQEFRSRFQKTVFWRTGVEKLKSNILAAMGME